MLVELVIHLPSQSQEVHEPPKNYTIIYFYFFEKVKLTHPNWHWKELNMRR